MKPRPPHSKVDPCFVPGVGMGTGGPAGTSRRILAQCTRVLPFGGEFQIVGSGWLESWHIRSSPARPLQIPAVHQLPWKRKPFPLRLARSRQRAEHSGTVRHVHLILREVTGPCFSGGTYREGACW